MNKRTWANAALYLGTTVVNSLLGLGGALLMTHLLAPNEFGRVGVFLSLLYIAAPMVSLAADGLIAVNKSTLGEAEYEEFRATAVAIAGTSTAVLQATAVGLWWLGVVTDPLILMVPLFALLRFASSMAATEYVAEQRAGIYATLTLLNGAAAFLLTYLFLSQWAASATGRIAALMAAETVLLWFRYRGRMHLLWRPHFHAQFRKQIVAFGLPSLVALFGAWGLNESDKAIVAHGFGLSVTGIYTAGAALAAVTMSFNQSLTNALFPGMFARLLQRSESLRALMVEYVLKFVAINGAFAALIMAGYFLVHDSLLPAKYAAASTYFYALVLASIGAAVFRPLGLATEYFKMARARAIAIVLGGAATMGVAIGGIEWSGNPLWAPAGVAIGYLVASVILAFSLNKISLDESPQSSH